MAHLNPNTKPMTIEVAPVKKYLLELTIENVDVALSYTMTWWLSFNELVSLTSVRMHPILIHIACTQITTMVYRISKIRV